MPAPWQAVHGGRFIDIVKGEQRKVDAQGDGQRGDQEGNVSDTGKHVMNGRWVLTSMLAKRPSPGLAVTQGIRRGGLLWLLPVTQCWLGPKEFVFVSRT